MLLFHVLRITRGPGAWRDAIKIQFTMRFPHPPFFELCTARFPFFSFLSGQVTRRSGIGEIGMRNARQEKVNQKVVPFFPFPPHLVEIVLQPQRDIGVKCPWSAVFLFPGPNVAGREVELGPVTRRKSRNETRSRRQVTRRDETRDDLVSRRKVSRRDKIRDQVNRKYFFTKIFFKF